MPRSRIGLCLACVAGAAFAQPLDLRVVPVTAGVVHSIREVHASAPAVAPKGSGPQTVGAPSDIEEAIPVGAVVARSFGTGTPRSEQKWQFGAAGTAEMQQRLAQTGYEVVVRMDDGERRQFRVNDPSRFRVGQRVSVRAGEVEPLPD